MKPGRRMWTIAELVPLVIVAAVVMVISPPFVTFALAATSAAVWCRWLDEHPESRRDESEGPTRA